MCSRNLVALHNSIDLMLMTLREPTLDKSTKREWLVTLDSALLIYTLFRARDARIVQVFLEQNVRVVVDLRSLDSEAIRKAGFMSMVERILVWVLLLPLTRVAAVEGEIGEVRHRALCSLG